MTTEKLAENNLNTQLSLLQDITREQELLLISIRSKAKAITKLLVSGKQELSQDQNKRTFTFTGEQIDELMNMNMMIECSDMHKQLSSLCEQSVVDINNKNKLLKLLTKEY